MKINGNIEKDLSRVFTEQKHYCAFIAFLMIHGFSTIVSTQYIGDHIILGRN